MMTVMTRTTLVEIMVMTTRILLALILLLSGCTGLSAFLTKHPIACSARWTGEIDEAFAEKANQDIAAAIGIKCEILFVALYSPGGSVVDGLEVVRLMRAAQDKIIIAVHGGGMVASMATMVLAAGTPGYRTIDPNTFTLIHAMRKYTGECVSVNAGPTEAEKIDNQIIYVMASVMAELTGQSVNVTMDWLKCDNSQVGNGKMLVDMGFADRVSR